MAYQRVLGLFMAAIHSRVHGSRGLRMFHSSQNLGVFTYVRPFQVHKGPRYQGVTRPFVYLKRAYIREHTEGGQHRGTSPMRKHLPP